MQYIVDRIEEEYAVLEQENGKIIDVKRKDLPVEIREGEVLQEENGRYVRDGSGTLDRQEKIRRQMNRLWKKE